MTEQILTSIKEGVVTVVIALIGLAVSFAISYIKKLSNKLQNEANKIEDDETKELATSTINRIEELAIATVSELEQEYGKAIRDSIYNNDGKYTRDDLVALKDIAINSIKSQIAEKAQEAVKSQITDIEAYISTKVSEALLNLKSQGSVPYMIPEVIEETLQGE